MTTLHEPAEQTRRMLARPVRFVQPPRSQAESGQLCPLRGP